jgi:hypothetical protein
MPELTSGIVTFRSTAIQSNSGCAFLHVLWDTLCFHFVLLATLCFHNRFNYSSLLIPNRLKSGSLRTCYASTR